MVGNNSGKSCDARYQSFSSTTEACKIVWHDPTGQYLNLCLQNSVVEKYRGAKACSAYFNELTLRLTVMPKTTNSCCNLSTDQTIDITFEMLFVCSIGQKDFHVAIGYAGFIQLRKQHRHIIRSSSETGLPRD